jgi:hypothetical protein
VTVVWCSLEVSGDLCQSFTLEKKSLEVSGDGGFLKFGRWYLMVVYKWKIERLHFLVQNVCESGESLDVMAYI